MSVTYSEVSSFINGHLLNVTSTKNGFHCKCPFCLDSKKNKFKKRFWFTYKDEENSYYHCFNCDEKGNFYELYAHIMGVSVKEAVNIFRQFDASKIRKRFIRPEEVLEEPTAVQEETLDWILDDCVKKPEGLLQEQLERILGLFQTNRKVTDYPMYVAHTGKFKNRIIIPIIENGKIIYFQGRAITNSMYPKYLNPTVEKSKIILNKLHFNRDKYIIVTEGLVDAMSIENNQGTSCLGAVVRVELLTELTKYTDRGIIIALDNDETGLKKLEVFLENSKFSSDVKYFMMPNEYHHIKDLNQMKTETNIENIYDYVVNNSFDKFKTLFGLKMRKTT